MLLWLLAAWFIEFIGIMGLLTAGWNRPPKGLGCIDMPPTGAPGIIIPAFRLKHKFRFRIKIKKKEMIGCYDLVGMDWLLVVLHKIDWQCFVWTGWRPTTGVDRHWPNRSFWRPVWRLVPIHSTTRLDLSRTSRFDSKTRLPLMEPSTFDAHRLLVPTSDLTVMFAFLNDSTSKLKKKLINYKNHFLKS